MKKAMLVGVAVCMVMMLVLSGCGGLRYGVTEAQKENAFLHARVCALAAQTAVEEDASVPLRALTGLAEKQSEAFVLDYGHPLPGSAGTGPYKGGELLTASELTDYEIEAMLSEGQAVAEQAQADSARRPDAWVVADGAMELGIALAGLLGGVYGARAAGFLRQAREKSKALQEIVAGNELFKQLYPEQAGRFKEAQAKQSPSTREIVTELK